MSEINIDRVDELKLLDEWIRNHSPFGGPVTQEAIMLIRNQIRNRISDNGGKI